jgi:SPP1 gp7 family putative phage head morphogenesis protein
LIQSFPITEEDAHKLVDPIEIKEPEPLPVLAPGQQPAQSPTAQTAGGVPGGVSAEVDGKTKLPPGSPAGDDQATPSAKPEVVAHTDDGKPRLVSMAAFQSAAMRVDFAVIDRRTTLASDDAVGTLARLVARATQRTLGNDQRMAELLDDDMTDIEHIKFDGGDVGKIKQSSKDSLNKGWAVGIEAAKRELAKAGKPSKASFASLQDRAAQYFEANGFRMAANISDGARAIIQQQLIQAVKEGMRAEEVIVQIFRLLIERGFTTLDAIELEVTAADIIDSVRNLLTLPESANVPAYLNTLVRTNVFESMNEARYAEFTDPALDNFVEALEYSAILDDRTTEICQQLDGKVYAADAPEWENYRPPNHYNCRSVLIPVTVTDQWDGEQSEKPSVQPAQGFGNKGGNE